MHTNYNSISRYAAAEWGVHSAGSDLVDAALVVARIRQWM